MTREEAATLLALRHARERRAAADLARAGAEVEAARGEVERAARMARAFEAMRRAQSAQAIQDLASSGPVSPGRVSETAAKLLDLGARANTYADLRARREAALAERERLRNRAQSDHQAAMRRAEAWSQLGERLDEAAARAEEDAAEEAIEEAAELRAARDRWTG
ncbi:hypothetical protein ACE7GA_22350 [Roseomonas sp. CCTCC AB2023176]|uniref:hypothetical protein n=1 Tax=Roseomonas sp. CCTCC AB2023176 TaxID=3342640 RepID=UPI0035DFE249